MVDIASIQSPLGRARGLGSAHTGSHHWWQHRMSMLANIPLAIWFAVSVALLSGQPYDVVRGWLMSPFTAVILMFTVFNFFLHAKLDIQLVVEDYIADKTVRLTTWLLIQSALWLCGALSLFAIIKIALG